MRNFRERCLYISKVFWRMIHWIMMMKWVDFAEMKMRSLYRIRWLEISIIHHQVRVSSIGNLMLSYHMQMMKKLASLIHLSRQLFFIFGLDSYIHFVMEMVEQLVQYFTGIFSKNDIGDLAIFLFLRWSRAQKNNTVMHTSWANRMVGIWRIFSSI